MCRLGKNSFSHHLLRHWDTVDQEQGSGSLIEDVHDTSLRAELSFQGQRLEEFDVLFSMKDSLQIEFDS